MKEPSHVSWDGKKGIHFEVVPKLKMFQLCVQKCSSCHSFMTRVFQETKTFSSFPRGALLILHLVPSGSVIYTRLDNFFFDILCTFDVIEKAYVSDFSCAFWLD